MLKELGIFSLIFVIVLSGCTTKSESLITTNVQDIKVQSEVKEFIITARQWEFEPSTITVNKGDTVRLIITSTDVTHGIIIPQFGVNLVLDPGQTETVEFVADKIGKHPFYCNVYCGAGHSQMKGVLIVK
jgi:cytochrome c oxidase subunit 2